MEDVLDEVGVVAAIGAPHIVAFAFSGGHQLFKFRQDQIVAAFAVDGFAEAIVDLFSNTSGIRDLEQAAEHIAANALYQIEVNHVTQVVFDAKMVRELLS